MTTLAHGISPELLQALGWTLLHFVWQGAALAALFTLANTLCRQAATRYALAVITLVLMMAAPVITFSDLRQPKDPAVRFGAQGMSAGAAKPVEGVSVTPGPSAPSLATRTNQFAVIFFVEAWFLGVLVLSLRTAGGVVLLRRMRPQEIKPPGARPFLQCPSP